MPIRKLIQVERQVLFAHMVVRAHDSALQERPERVNVSGVNLAAHILALAVLYRLVLIIAVQEAIAGMLIGRNERDFFIHGFTNETIKRSHIGILNHLANDIALTGDSSYDRNLASGAATLNALGEVLIPLFAAHVRLINFDFAAVTAKHLCHVFILHCGADSVAHIPSRSVVARTDLPMNLQCADSLLALGHQVNDFKPSLERIVGILENRSRDNREAVAVLTAAILILTKPVKRARLQGVNLLAIAARATNAIRPAQLHQILLAGFIRRVLSLDLMERDIGLRAKDFCFHGSEYSNCWGRCQAQHNRLYLILPV